jgi:redox-sensitive bicupin YhaK (pirin superfamily)
MKVRSGRVVDGKVVVDGEPLIEGATVTIVEDDEESFDVTPEEEAVLLVSTSAILEVA